MVLVRPLPPFYRYGDAYFLHRHANPLCEKCVHLRNPILIITNNSAFYWNRVPCCVRVQVVEKNGVYQLFWKPEQLFRLHL